MSAPAQAHVLVVDDEEVIVGLLQRMLEQAGYAVLTATDGSEAWELFQANPCDAAIIDLRLPGIDGEELTRRIIAVAPRTPILILTGHGTPDQVERLHRLGIVRVLYKPLREMKMLLSLLEKLLPAR